MKSQIANRKSEIGTWEEAERVMEELAQEESERRMIQANIDAGVAAVHAKFGSRMEEENARIGELEAALARFGKKHKKEFRPKEEGGETRSYEHAGVVMGFRKTTPAVRIENEPKAVDFLATHDGGRYVRTRTEPDRQGLAEALKDDSDPFVEKLAAHGITLQQKDKFFCEVKEQK